MRRDLSSRKDRLGAALLSAALTAALGWALVTALGFRVVPATVNALKLFNLADQPPPPAPIVPPPPPRKQRKAAAKDKEGAAAPPALRNTPTEIKAPEAERTPMAAAKIVGTGSAAAAGASPTPGPGTGAGGLGNGLGAGSSGTGTGGGGRGLAAPAQQIAGDIGNQDYPPSALNARAQGTTLFSFTVRTDGRIEDCRIERSSGSRALDDTTCALALARLRWRPARDAAGRVIAVRIHGEQEWRLGREQELPADDE